MLGTPFRIRSRSPKAIKGDLGEQGEKLTAMIGIAVHGLDRLIVPGVETLGIRSAASA